MDRGASKDNNTAKRKEKKGNPPGRILRCKRRESNKHVSRDESSEIMHKIVRCCTVENNLIGLEGRQIQLFTSRL